MRVWLAGQGGRAGGLMLRAGAAWRAKAGEREREELTELEEEEEDDVDTGGTSETAWS